MRTTSFASIVTTALVLTVALLVADTAQAQGWGGRGGRGGGGFGPGGGFGRGGFGPEAIIDRLDEDDDGRLDEDEIARDRFLSGMLQRADIDTSKGLDEDDLEEAFENMRGGFGRGGFGGDRGGRGRGGSNRRDRGNDRSREPEPPPRVTVDLQATYAAGDANGDGQVALSEWIAWKGRAALADFLSLDQNGDGILTPRELAQTDNSRPVDLATYFPGAHPAALQPGGGSTLATTSTKPGSTRAGRSESTSTETASRSAAADEETTPVSAHTSADVERHTANAQRQFKLLDRNGDGVISDLEWRRSRRLRPRFEEAGADLSKPMSEEQFTATYVKSFSSS